jgi:hypothetical protein
MDQVLRALLGKKMWIYRRAADMAGFHFGDRIPVKDYYERPSEVGEYAMHIQCAWRIVKDGRVLVASRDLYYPAGDLKDDSIPEGFDWDRDQNRRDTLLNSMFTGPGFTVRDVHLGLAGMCNIEFDEGLALEIFPDDSLTHEHWRLFATQDVDRQLIVAGGQPVDGGSASRP